VNGGRRAAPLLMALAALGVLPPLPERRRPVPAGKREEDEPATLLVDGQLRHRAGLELAGSGAVRPTPMHRDLLLADDKLDELKRTIERNTPELRPEQLLGLSDEMRARLGGNVHRHISPSFAPGPHRDKRRSRKERKERNRKRKQRRQR
jgi:hypothetical protein